MRPVLITPPAEPPVTLAEFKQHTRVSHNDDDAVLTMMIEGATSHLDGAAGVLGRCIVTQTWRQDFSGFWRVMRLPFPDVSAVTSITYRDDAGADQTVNPVNYRLHEAYAGTELHLASGYSWPAVQTDDVAPVSVTFTAGFGTAADVPQAIKVAIMQLAAHWYEHREASSVDPQHSVPLAYDALIAPYRVVRL